MNLTVFRLTYHTNIGELAIYPFAKPIFFGQVIGRYTNKEKIVCQELPDYATNHQKKIL
jgi:hypothetical protein